MNAPERRVPLLIVAIDGVVRHSPQTRGRPILTRQDVIAYPQTEELMARWKSGGGRIIGIADHGDVALGKVAFGAVKLAMIVTHKASGSHMDSIVMCIHHPEADEPEMRSCWCKLPSPGGFIESALDLAALHHEMYPPYMGVLVGIDEQHAIAAKLAGFDFMTAEDWWRRGFPVES